MNQGSRKLWSLCVLIFLLLLTNGVWAKEEIQVILVQPAIYSAKKGETYTYQLEMSLPKDYEKRYRAFSVSVRFDRHLDVINYEITTPEAAKKQGALTKTDLKEYDIINYSSGKLSTLKDAHTIDVTIKAKLKSDVKEPLKNSFVLTTMDAKGKEISSQKDLSTAVSKKPGVLEVEPLAEGSSTIKGKTEKGAVLLLLQNNNILAQGKADEKGAFSILVPKQESGDRITVISQYKSGGIPVELKEEIVVGSEGKILEEPKKTEEKNPVGKEFQSEEKKAVSIDTAGEGALADYLAFGKTVNVSGLDRENVARLVAALAQGQYVEVKKDASASEEKAAIDEIRSAIQAIQPKFMSGYSDGTFRPRKDMTRGEVATVLYRILGGKPGISPDFTDVETKDWYGDAVGYMEKKGLISGYKDNTFRPKRAITRGEFAAVLVKTLKLEVSSGETSFNDVEPGHWTYSYIAAAEKAGILKGDNKGNFRPSDKITRAEATALINRSFKRSADSEFFKAHGKNHFSDVEEKYWAYGDILSATGSY